MPDQSPNNETRYEPEEESSSFRELLLYTVSGYLAGLLVGGILDLLGYQRAALGQWLVRTLGGESESLFEGFFALR